MTDIADLMRKAAKPASPKPPGDMHPAHRANAIRKAERDGDAARLAELQADPKE